MDNSKQASAQQLKVTVQAPWTRAVSFHFELWCVSANHSDDLH